MTDFLVFALLISHVIVFWNDADKYVLFGALEGPVQLIETNRHLTLVTF